MRTDRDQITDSGSEPLLYMSAVIQQQLPAALCSSCLLRCIPLKHCRVNVTCLLLCNSQKSLIVKLTELRPRVVVLKECAKQCALQ